MKKFVRFLVVLVGMSSICRLAIASWWDSEAHYNGYIQQPTEKIVSVLLSGKKVLFIDTREAEEYQEGRIPKAVNIMLRDIGKVNLTELKQYDLIVPYCLKDFRGFEVSRALMEKGLNNIVMMEPAGLNGWKALGLPIATDRATTYQAIELLKARFQVDNINEIDGREQFDQ